MQSSGSAQSVSCPLRRRESRCLNVTRPVVLVVMRTIQTAGKTTAATLSPSKRANRLLPPPAADGERRKNRNRRKSASTAFRPKVAR